MIKIVIFKWLFVSIEKKNTNFQLRKSLNIPINTDKKRHYFFYLV